MGRVEDEMKLDRIFDDPDRDLDRPHPDDVGGEVDRPGFYERQMAFERRRREESQHGA